MTQTKDVATPPEAAPHYIRAIRRAAVPLVLVETTDPAASRAGCVKALNGKAGELPLAQWDINSGLVGLNDAGAEAFGWFDPLVHNLPEMLKAMGAADGVKAAKGGVVFLLNVHRYFDRDGVAQGVWNLREAYKAAGVVLVMLCPPGVKLPLELENDVVTITEPVPNRADVARIADAILADAATAKFDVAKDQTEAGMAAIASALIGLPSAFDVEQTLALECEKKTGVNVPGVWRRKISRLKATSGAEITIDNPTFDDLVGNDNVKSEITAFINGREKVGCILFFDEPEKLFAGAGTDSSGVTSSLVGMTLSFMQDNSVRAFLGAGIPGSGKTRTGQCAAGAAGVPFIKVSDIKGSLVGESERKLRAVFSAAKAMAGDGAIMAFGACNWVDQLPPELLARFSMGQFFYDFPTKAELSALFAYFMRKYSLPEQTLPDCDGWVGREVESCCYRAWQFNRPLVDVARNICPSSVSQAAKLDALRQSCTDRFLSASAPGLYKFRKVNPAMAAMSAAGRAMSS